MNQATSSIAGVRYEAELDLERARRGPELAQIVQRRWQLPVLADVFIEDQTYLSPEWATSWFFNNATRYRDEEIRKPSIQDPGSRSYLRVAALRSTG